jgi:hypothetical protein
MDVVIKVFYLQRIAYNSVSTLPSISWISAYSKETFLRTDLKDNQEKHIMLIAEEF